MKNNLHRVLAGILGAVLGGAGFAIVGLSLPYFYTKYIDQTNFYYISPNPLLVEEPILNACDIVKYRGTRYSAVDFNDDFIVNLIRKSESVDHNAQVIDGKASVISVTKGIVDLELSYELPCEIKAGEYYLLGTVIYRVNGVEKVYNWQSETFTVNPKTTKK